MAKGLPDRFPPAEKSHSLYEGVEYQEFWEDPRLRRQDALEQHIISEMLPTSGRRILDLGCGHGRLTPCYRDRFDQAVLCDGSLSLLREARAAVGSTPTLVAADVAHLPFRPASFDCVLTIRVLQHIHDLDGALIEVRRVIAGNGRLVFSYHNKRNAKRIVRYFAARGASNPFSLVPTEPMPTLISRHPRMVELALQEAGFSPPEYQGTALVHPLASFGERFGRQAPAGAGWGWARFMGRSKLAPWLIGNSFAEADNELKTAGAIDEIFQCPVCQAAVGRSDEGFECLACHRAYPIEDGIFDFRP